MLSLTFFGQNIHFALSLFASLVFFATFWLYFDAWLDKRKVKELAKWLGFLLVSISFLLHSTVLEASAASFFGSYAELFSGVLLIAGFLAIIWGMIIDPLQPLLDLEGLEFEKSKKPKKISAVLLLIPTIFLKAVFPLGACAIGVLYLRRAKVGLEKHLKPVAFSFFLLTLSELFSLATFSRSSDNPLIYNFSAAFGPAWIIEHSLLLMSIVILAKWVWSYLVTRLQSQLFMIFTTMALLIFLVTTISFTTLLIQNIQRESLTNLEVSEKFLDYALVSKKAETLTVAESLAQNPEIISALAAKDHKKLAGIIGKVLETKKQSTLVITDSFARVMVRAEDPERWGNSISEEPLIKRALIGSSSSSAVTKEDVLAPTVFIKSAVPIRDGSNNIIGAVETGIALDSGFTDGIKNATGLDSAVYAGNIQSATTFLATDGKHRNIGIKEGNNAVNKQVLQKGETFKGDLSVLNRPYLAVYAPLRDVDNNTIGMLFVGKSEFSILQTTGKSVELTFMVATILLALSIVPAYFLSKYLTNQLK